MHRIYIKKSYCLHELFTPSAVFSNFSRFSPPLHPLVCSEGDFGSRVAWRKFDSKFCRVIVLLSPPLSPNISLHPTPFSVCHLHTKFLSKTDNECWGQRSVHGYPIVTKRVNFGMTTKVSS